MENIKKEALKQEAQPKDAAGQAPQSAKRKNKKIGRMAINEVEEKINMTIQNMGRLDSRYGRELLKRKDALNKKI